MTRILPDSHFLGEIEDKKKWKLVNKEYPKLTIIYGGFFVILFNKLFIYKNTKMVKEE